MELGIYSFGDMARDPLTGMELGAYQRIKNLLEEIKLTDELGLDIYAVGEHHRPDYSVSSPATVLAAAAMITKKIKLSSAVTVLSSDDPVRVYQSFSTVDLISKGRAEIMLGRGSFIESFPLFGYDLANYDDLFTEKLELLLELNSTEKISWKGIHRASIDNLGVYPRPFSKQLPIWIAVGGTPASVMRAGNLGLPLALAIIGGSPDQFVPLINLYKEYYSKANHDLSRFQLGINTHVFVSDTSQKAAADFYPYYADAMSRIGKERGWSPMYRPQYEMMRSKKGALMVGSVQEVIDKMMYEYELFGHTRFLAQMSVGAVPHDKLMHSIELFGTQVAPVIRSLTSKK